MALTKPKLRTRALSAGHLRAFETDHDTRFKHNEWLTWERWLDAQKPPDLEPKR